jgi:hypothetical protein
VNRKIDAETYLVLPAVPCGPERAQQLLAPLRLLCRRFGPDADEIFVVPRQLLYTPDHDLMGRSEDLLQRSLLALEACYITLGCQSRQYPFNTNGPSN